MTLPVARDLSRDGIRVCTIAPGISRRRCFRHAERRAGCARQTGAVPAALGKPSDYAQLVSTSSRHEMLNGEVIRLDGAIRMAPK